MKCQRCGVNRKPKARSFSTQATAALEVWGELEKHLIDEPICDHCYEELRDVLIERSAEIFDSPVENQIAG